MIRTKVNLYLKKGPPIFNQIFLADEINRTSPKTQSSLLQAMEEGEISTEEGDYILEKPFFCTSYTKPFRISRNLPPPTRSPTRPIFNVFIHWISRYEIRNGNIKNHQSIKT